LLKALSLQPAATGRVDFVASLSAQGRNGPELRQALAGRVTLRGHQLTLNGRNLDEALSRFESSQRFSLVDAGAFFIVGPLGLVLTKAYDFANAYRGAGGTSAIQTLVSDWKFDHGVARAQDVAMATAKYRIALHGGLDVVHERFDDVSLALVDAAGCVMVQQRITGSFQKPVVEEPNLLHALAGPALSLLQKARDLLPGTACSAFYSGSVPAPG
jgi:AsmA protein